MKNLLDPKAIATKLFITGIVILVGAIVDVQFLKADVSEIQRQAEDDRAVISKTHQVTCLMAIQNKTLTDQEKASFCAGVR